MRMIRAAIAGMFVIPVALAVSAGASDSKTEPHPTPVVVAPTHNDELLLQDQKVEAADRLASRRADIEAWVAASTVKASVASRPTPARITQGPDDAAWDRLAQCESGGNWSINTGNGYSGGLQWSPGSWQNWRAPTDPSYAWQASREQQIAAAERYRSYEVSQGRGGFGPWPACGRRLGLPQ